MQRSTGVFSSKIANETAMSTEKIFDYSPEALVKALSPERLTPYLAETSGNLVTAIDLYRRNIEISGAFYEILGIAEVSLRNTLNEQLTALDAKQGGLWFENLGNILTEDARRDITLAQKRASRKSIQETPGAVVAELSFGFWRYLLAKRYETSLWTPALRHGFPGLVRRQRAAVYSAVSDLHILRNRIAHHEPILQRNLSQDLLTTFRLLDWISEDTSKWALSFSKVDNLMSNY